MLTDDDPITVSPLPSTPTEPGGGGRDPAPGASADEAVNFDHVLLEQGKMQTKDHGPVA